MRLGIYVKIGATHVFGSVGAVWSEVVQGHGQCTMRFVGDDLHDTGETFAVVDLFLQCLHVLVELRVDALLLVCDGLLQLLEFRFE